MSKVASREFAFDEAYKTTAGAAKIAGAGAFERERGGDLRGDDSGSAERGQGAADDDEGRCAGWRLGGDAVSVLSEQELFAAGGAAETYGSSDPRCGGCMREGEGRFAGEGGRRTGGGVSCGQGGAYWSH